MRGRLFAVMWWVTTAIAALALVALAGLGVWLAARPCSPGDLGIRIGSVVRLAGC